jgi:threonine/homoserine/homoserine lactone efflux protein
MTPNLLLACMGFAFVTSITPGPNNTMLLASGVNYGLTRTIPHIAGISTGCVVMLILVGLGLGEVFTRLPVLYAILRYAGAAYLVWLAWHVATAGPVGLNGARSRPMRFLEAAAFQWVNPKAWIIAVGAVTAYAPRDDFLRSIGIIAIVLVVVGAPCLTLWAGSGAALRVWLAHPNRRRSFNLTMAALLLLSLYPMLVARY